MSQIKKKFIGTNQVDGQKIKLSNDEALRARNAADSADIDLIKLNASNEPVLAAGAKVGSDRILTQADLGANSGVATLDANGRVPISQLPNSIMEYQGVWNASTNSPALADGSGNADPAIGNVYRVSVAGSQDLGSGSISFAVGDYVILNASKVWEKADTTDAVSSVNGQTGAVTVAEYSAATARADLIASSISNGDTTHAPSGDAVFDALALKSDVGHTHVAADVTDFASAAKSAAVADAIANGVLDVAPSQNAVFDALALKANLSHSHVAADITDFASAAKSAAVADAIANGVTDVAPSQNAVFDALALKADLSYVNGRSAWYSSEDLIPADVTWVNTANTTANGNDLQKTGGTNLFWDADGSSSQQITAVGGYVQGILSTTGNYALGLSTNDSDASQNDLDYAVLRVGNGVAAYRNGAAVQSLGTTSNTDVWKLSVEAGPVVKIYRNGSLEYTFADAPTLPMHAEASFSTSGMIITDVVILSSMVPSASLGLNGDFYVHPTTRDVYQKVSGAWSVIGSVASGNFQADGSVPMTGDLNMGGNDINNVMSLNAAAGNNFLISAADGNVDIAAGGSLPIVRVEAGAGVMIGSGFSGAAPDPAGPALTVLTIDAANAADTLLLVSDGTAGDLLKVAVSGIEMPAGQLAVGGTITNLPDGANIWFKANDGLVLESASAGNWATKVVAGSGGADFLRFDHSNDKLHDGSESIVRFKNDGSIELKPVSGGSEEGIKILNPNGASGSNGPHTFQVNAVGQIFSRDLHTEDHAYIGGSVMTREIRAQDGSGLLDFHVNDMGNGLFKWTNGSDAQVMSLSDAGALNVSGSLAVGGQLNMNGSNIVGAAQIVAASGGAELQLRSDGGWSLGDYDGDGNSRYISYDPNQLDGNTIQIWGPLDLGDHAFTSANYRIQSNGTAEFGRSGPALLNAPDGRYVAVTDTDKDIVGFVAAAKAGTNDPVEAILGVWTGTNPGAWVGSSSDHYFTIAVNYLNKMSFFAQNEAHIYGDGSGDIAPRGLHGAGLVVFANSTMNNDHFAAVDENEGRVFAIEKDGNTNLYGHKIVNLAAPTANNDAATKLYVDTAIGSGGTSAMKETITLGAGDITNQYVDLAHEVDLNSLHLSIDGVDQYEGEDFTLSVVGGVTRVTFAGDLATAGASALEAGDKLRFMYRYPNS